MSQVVMGQGPPLVLVPGLQGRWEWHTDTIRALAAHARVASFSLNDVTDGPGVFDRWFGEIDALVDRLGGRAVVMGVSFGGLVAARYAARRRDRVRGLVLVSAPAPDLQIDPRMLTHVRRPILTFPVFAVRSVGRLLPEVLASRPTWAGRVGFALAYVRWPLLTPGSPRRMSLWVQAWRGLDPAALRAEIAGVTAPTLLVTGEPALDGVVPVSSTLRYRELIPGAAHVVLPRTGHMGLVSQPESFAALVAPFIARMWNAP